MSDDIKNFREAIAKFDEILLGLSILNDALGTNFLNYKNVSDFSSDISEKEQSILTNINALQINAKHTQDTSVEYAENLMTKMSKYYSDEYTKTRKDLDALLLSITNEFSTLKSTTKATIQSAVNDVNIDTSELSKIIDKKINGINIEAIEVFTASVNNFVHLHNNDFDDAISKLAISKTSLDTSVVSLDATVTKITNSSNKLKSDIKKINWVNYGMIAITSLSAGLIIGGGGMFFKAFDLVDYAYKEEYQKSLQVLDKLPKLYQYLEENDIDVHFGLFNDTKKPYLAIDREDTTTQIYDIHNPETIGCFVRPSGRAYIRLAEDKTIGL